MKQSNVSFEAKIADNDEYKKLLVEKMQEEVQELMEDQDLEEAADVYEVFLALIKLWGHDIHEVIAVADEKREARGGFVSRIVLVKSDTYTPPETTQGSRYSNQLFGTPGSD